ncbi:hypothetical protein WG66_006085 [Moniliophthora roreri]|nr:hypothetical protein WG66_006085 [Moniliophthora roreri]
MAVLHSLKRHYRHCADNVTKISHIRHPLSLAIKISIPPHGPGEPQALQLELLLQGFTTAVALAYRR